MSSGEMSFREKCLIGRNVLGRNVLGRTVLGRNGFWGEMSYIHSRYHPKKMALEMSYMIFGTVSVLLMNINFEISLKLVLGMRLAIKSVLYLSMN